MEPFTGIDEMLEKAYDGDKTSEKLFFEKISARISSLLRYRIQIGKSNRKEIAKEVDDVLQEILLVIIDRYQKKSLPKEYVLRWIFSVTNNKIADYFRTVYARTDRIISLEDLPYSLMTKELVENSIGLKDVILGALFKLGDRCKEIIRALLDGEIKEYIKEHSSITPVDAIYIHIHRCRKRFIKRLKDEGYEK